MCRWEDLHPGPAGVHNNTCRTADNVLWDSCDNRWRGEVCLVSTKTQALSDSKAKMHSLSKEDVGWATSSNLFDGIIGDCDLNGECRNPDLLTSPPCSWDQLTVSWAKGITIIGNGRWFLRLGFHYLIGWDNMRIQLAIVRTKNPRHSPCLLCHSLNDLDM